MMDQIKGLIAKFNALSLRERVFLAAAAMVVIGAVWQALLMGPIESRETRASKKLANLQERLANLDQSMDATAMGMNDGMPDRLQRLTVLKAKLAETQDSVKVFTSDLVDPEQMRFVLEDLIAQQKGLSVLSVSNLPAESLFEEEPESDGDQGPELYRHGVLLVLEGPYLEALRYLQTIETLPWRFFWSRVEIEVDEYPRTRILIELNTLSLQQEWIGV
jgi:MSHA biogenesis protein MshJ